MIYNARNRSNDKTENHKEKESCFNHETEIACTSQFVLMSYPRHFVPMFCGTASLALLLACSKFFFAKMKGFFLIKLFLYKCTQNATDSQVPHSCSEFNASIPSAHSE